MAAQAKEAAPRRAGMKRLVDVSLAAAGLTAASPIMMLIALAVRAGSEGPAIYAQERLGRARRPFRIFKFRTMTVDAERNGPQWSRAGDPRVTAVGRVLRKTHLDELPQLWNVLRGEMSLVGPRPEREHFVSMYEPRIPGYADRFKTKPGVTGLSQIRSGYDESEATVRRKIRYDRWYVQNESALVDARIMADTVSYLVTTSFDALRRSALARVQQVRAAAAALRGIPAQPVRVAPRVAPRIR